MPSKRGARPWTAVASAVAGWRTEDAGNSSLPLLRPVARRQKCDAPDDCPPPSATESSTETESAALPAEISAAKTEVRHLHVSSHLSHMSKQGQRQKPPAKRSSVEEEGDGAEPPPARPAAKKPATSDRPPPQPATKAAPKPSAPVHHLEEDETPERPPLPPAVNARAVERAEDDYAEKLEDESVRRNFPATSTAVPSERVVGDLAFHSLVLRMQGIFSVWLSTWTRSNTM